MKNLCFIVGFIISVCLNFSTVNAQVSSEISKSAESKEEISKPKFEVQVNYTTETLSRNLGTWRTAALYMEYRGTKHRTIWTSYRVYERNARRDQEFNAGIYKSLKKGRAFTLEATYSPTSNSVAKFSFAGEIEKAFKNGWVGHLGARHLSFKTAKVNSVYAMAEKYWGNSRGVYTLSLTKITATKTAPTHRLSYNHYYGERLNTFGISVSTGREYEYLGQTQGIIRNQTWTVGGSIKHWMTKNFAVSVDASLHRQGNLYYRRGLNLGIRYRF